MLHECVNFRDVAVFFFCVSPVSALVYLGCYHMLQALHPSENEYMIFATYGFLQFSLGYVTGFGSYRLMYHSPPEAEDDEDTPLLMQTDAPINHTGADIAETFAA